MGRATAEYEKAGEGQRSQRLCVALISKRAGELGNAKNAEERCAERFHGIIYCPVEIA